MTSEKTFCPSCGSATNEDSVFCKECGRPVCLYEKNIIHRLNDRINLLSILIGFFSTAIFIVLCSLFFNLFLSNGLINFMTYIALTTITTIFFGGLTIGLVGCSDYHDAKSNSITFILIILNIVAIIFGVTFSTTMGLASALSSAFGGFDLESTSSSTGFGSTPTTTDSGSSGVIIFEVLIIVILSIAVGIGACYLGVFLKNFVKDK